MSNGPDTQDGYSLWRISTLTVQAYAPVHVMIALRAFCIAGDPLHEEEEARLTPSSFSLLLVHLFDCMHDVAKPNLCRFPLTIGRGMTQ